MNVTRMNLPLTKTNMILPDDVLKIIREFSLPIGLRLDWRRCKRNESRRIKGSNLALLLWYKWILGYHPLYAVHPLYQEISEWTFYGRRHLVYESRIRFWTQVTGEPTEQDRQWYEKRYVLIDDGVHRNMPFPVETHMSQVSLTV
jgi:hypothetical protein